MKKFSDEQINSIKNDLNKWFPKGYAESFDRSKDKAKWFKVNQDELLTNDQFIKKYDIEELFNTDFKPMDYMYKRYPDYSKLTENQIKRFENTSGLSRDELKKYYDSETERKQGIAKINEERWKAIDKQRNEGERAKDNSYYMSPVANEYARKHYIQGHPTQAAINEVAGKVAAASDFLPWPYSYGGPAIRTVQKWAADEPVANTHTALDWGAGSLGILGKIVPGVKDFARTTTSRLSDIFLKGKGQNTKEIKSVVNAKLIKEQQEEAARELALITKNLDNMTDRQLIEIEANTTNPILKSNVRALLKAKGEYRTAEMVRGNKNVVHNDEAANRAADIAAEKAEAYDKAINKAATDAANIQPTLEVQANKVKGGQVYGYEGDPDALLPYFKDVPAEDIVKFEQANMQPKWYNTLAGQAILAATRKAANNRIASRRWDEIDYDPKYDEDKAIKDIIGLYENDWLNNVQPHMDDPLVKAAYDKWLSDLRMSPNGYSTLYKLGEY